MSIKSYCDKQENLEVIKVSIKPLMNKELLIALYFLFFIFGLTTRYYYAFYNEYKVIQLLLLLVFGWGAFFYRHGFFSKVEWLFFAFITLGSLIWAQPAFVITELLLFYLLYQSFKFLNYRQLTSKLVVLASLTIFILLPFSLWDYIRTGHYQAIWYPLSWNIRVYDSYFLIVSIFAVWFCLTKQSYRYFYLLLLFLSFFSILLDGGRSVSIAYTLFITIVSMAYRHVRWHFIFTYMASWFAYLAITYIAGLAIANGHEDAGLQIARESSSGRIDLWINAYQCWLQHPIIGCGFYQLEQYPALSAHPHNLFIQVLTETGLLGFAFLLYIILMIIRQINWSQSQRYFVVAAFLAVGVDLFFSGVHIYPVTQMALLWLFVFLLKNPEFSSSNNIYQPSWQINNGIIKVLPFLIYILISAWFVCLLTNTNVLLSETPITPPRFWVYGYQL